MSGNGQLLIRLIQFPWHEKLRRQQTYCYIMYLDANNLYGWATLQPPPTSNFKWLEDEEMEELDVIMMPDDR